jgi:hypothetical protein
MAGAYINAYRDAIAMTAPVRTVESTHAKGAA